MTMVPYVVRPGDHLARLAHEMGFDADTVWQDGANASLRQLRASPQMLAPCDILYVPAAPTPVRGRALHAGAENRFSAEVEMVSIRVAFRWSGGSFHDEPFRIEGLPGEPITGTTDGDGVVAVDLPVHATSVRVVFPQRHHTHELRIGHLDPIETESGVRSRLRHLGYLISAHDSFGAPPPAPERLAHELQRAIRGFQRERSLPATGAMDDATRSALTEAHGG